VVAVIKIAQQSSMSEMKIGADVASSSLLSSSGTS
jgi:hypothetical protein